MKKVSLSRLRLLRPSDRAGRVPAAAPAPTAKPSKLEPQTLRPKPPKPPQLSTR